MHRRLSPVEYGFRTQLFTWLIDLDELPQVCARSPWISHNRPNLYSFRDADHLWVGHPDLRANVESYLRREGVPQAVGRIRLLTHLRTFGHVFNPVSFFFIDGMEGQPLAVIAEVHNTFGELKPFLLPPERWNGRTFEHTADKAFYISPFSSLDNELGFDLSPPGEKLRVHIRNSAAGEVFFHSSLTGHRLPISTRNLLPLTLRFPWVTLKVVFLIHWHAFRLHRLGVPFHRKSERLADQKGILPKRPA